MGPAQAQSPLQEIDRRTAKWQDRLLPFMILVLVALAIFACVANVTQVKQVQAHIEAAHEINLEPALAPLVGVKDITPNDRFIYARWQTLALLEVNSIESRYHQAGVMLMTRVYIVFLGFATGMVLALVGATFILGKLRESESKIDGTGVFGTFSLSSASPGLVLALFGTILMMATILTKSEITVKDQSLYVPEPLYTTGGKETADPGKQPGTTPAQRTILDSVRDRLAVPPKP
jgi:hypothetical protein